MLLDLHLTLLYLPLPLFPITGFCVGGLLKYLPYFFANIFPFELYILFLCACGASINLAFIYRYAVIADKLDEWFSLHKTLFAIVVFPFLYASPGMFIYMMGYLFEMDSTKVFDFIVEVMVLIEK